MAEACPDCNGAGVRWEHAAVPLFRAGLMTIFDSRIVPQRCDACVDGTSVSACPACEPSSRPSPGTDISGPAGDKSVGGAPGPFVQAALVLIVMVALVFGGLAALQYPKSEPACAPHQPPPGLCVQTGSRV